MGQGRVTFSNGQSIVFNYNDPNWGKKIDEAAVQSAAAREIKARGLQGRVDDSTFVTASKQTFPWQNPVMMDARRYGDSPLARLFGSSAGAAVRGALNAKPAEPPKPEAGPTKSEPASGGNIDDLPSATLNINDLPNA